MSLPSPGADAFALERNEEAQRLSEAYAEGDPGAAEEREAEELAQLAEDAREAGASAPEPVKPCSRISGRPDGSPCST